MSISVIITTRNKSAYLNLTLLGLDLQLNKDFEIIICDDESTDNTDQVVEKWGEKFENLIYIKNNKRLGAAESRNRAVTLANKELILFLDDDRLLLPNGIQEHLIKNKDNYNSFVCGERWELYSGMTPSSREIIKDQLLAQKLVRRHIEPMPRVMSKAYINGGENWQFRWYCILTGNLSVPKAIIESLNGFDPTFERLEDLELGYRAVENGYGVIYSPEIESFHLAHKRENYNEVLSEVYKNFNRKHIDKSIQLMEAFMSGHLCIHEYEQRVLYSLDTTLECKSCQNKDSRVLYFNSSSMTNN
ncbi:glycosyltransferase family 2 protein [Metabacillus halosaccharovorans]|uniref:glycosyltransferase family 2 protein n=1 Tax=Metabacillus halosaccharovorans TaxID=930124 RepID=UPI00203A561C|nr:glycosyltransferase [Metabacillus halosaccharovorans]MCM3444732.1 glycosyltransferase [Metabacillus halosaccharovorans]